MLDELKAFPGFLAHPRAALPPLLPVAQVASVHIPLPSSPEGQLRSHVLSSTMLSAVCGCLGFLGRQW